MRVEKELAVNAPVDRVYQLWTDFENFPRFMTHVESVAKTGDDMYHWKARLGGRDVEWDAKVVGQVPNRSVTWRSTSGAENAGAVNLAAQGNVTLMQVVIEYHPSWFEGLVATVTGEMSRSVEADLESFKRLAEGVESGGAGRNEAQGAAGAATTVDQDRSATAQGTTSQSVGPGNTGAHGPSAERAGLTTADSARAAGSAGSATGSSGSAAGTAGTPASDTGDQSWVVNDRGSNDAVAVSAGTTATSSSGTSSPGHAGAVVSGSAAGSGGAAGDLAGQAGNRAADSMDFSTRSGEREHGAGAPPIDETAGTDRPVPVETGDTDSGGTSQAMDSGSQAALGPSLYSNEAAGLTSPTDPGTGTSGDGTEAGDTATGARSASGGAGGTGSMATAGTSPTAGTAMGTATGSASSTTPASGNTAAGVGSGGQTTGTISGGMAASDARPIDAERGTPGLVGGTGGWGTSTGGSGSTNTSGPGAPGI